MFQQVLAVSLSIYTMVAIGIDRYYAIKCPLKNRASHHRGRYVRKPIFVPFFLLFKYICSKPEINGKIKFWIDWVNWAYSKKAGVT